SALFFTLHSPRHFNGLRRLKPEKFSAAANFAGQILPVRQILPGRIERAAWFAGNEFPLGQCLRW
ncbi:MAG TPA: hypothetical protein PLA85_03685, partial [Micropepsaceae bacterium]|nr:hypothetical protein [Micropepsaceae bacterium]